MRDEIRALLPRHLPGHAVRSVRALGEGLDNSTYEVNGELSVTRSKEADPDLRAEVTRREAALLAAVAGISTLPGVTGWWSGRVTGGRPGIDEKVPRGRLKSRCGAIGSEAQEIGRTEGR